MHKVARSSTSFAASFAVHAALLVALLFFTLPGNAVETLMAIDSVVEEPRDRLDVEKKLDMQERAATTFNTTPGSVSTQAGGTQTKLAARQKIEIDTTMKEIDVPFSPSEAFMPGDDEIVEDYGTGVKGMPQMLVRGYGPALDQLTRELIRLMRSHKLVVVWLFDESASMTDDQKIIKQRIGRVFQELKLVDKEADKLGISKKIQKSRGTSRSLLNEIMLTSIASFGADYHQQTRAPTSELPRILSAIDRIPVDKSGRENLCAALLQAMSRHGRLAARQKRKLVLVVISDESGDDCEGGVEKVVRQAKVLKSPIYILGREAVFGSKYAHVRWVQKGTGRVYYLPIRRGPEAPFPELLQHDGFRRRHDSHMSGFGPFDQVRMCRETNGIFFQLPFEQQNLNDFDDRKYEALALQEYLPSLESRAKYAVERDRSPFRKAIWDVIVMLNPYRKLKTVTAFYTAETSLELPNPQYQRFTTNPNDFGPKVKARLQKVQTLLALFERAIVALQKVRPLRAKEPSRRWRANYDLILAQLHWYQLRLFEYGIGLEQFVRKGAKNKPTDNRWYIRETGRNLVLPDELNQKRFKVTPQELQDKYYAARARLEEVRRMHPGTPWATRAAWELKRPFGVTFGTYYQPPPKPGKSRPRPRPPKPPNL